MVKESQRTIYGYDDYRAFLRDRLEELKRTSRGFTYRALAKRAGFASWSFLPFVLKGERNLGKESAAKLGLVLGLSGREGEYFATLVELNQCTSLPQKNDLYQRLNRLRPAAEVRQLAELEHAFYTTWYLPAIRELLEFSSFKDDPQWIGQMLSPAISKQEAKEALESLEQLGFIVRDNGQLKKQDRSLSTGGEVRSLLVRSFHHAMLVLAQRALQEILPEDRDISSLTLSITRDQFQQLKDLLAGFRKDALAAMTTNDKADRIYQLNFQLFPLTRLPSKEADGTTLSEK